MRLGVEQRLGGREGSGDLKATLMPTGSPLSRPLDLVLHIGLIKTGSSSIQYFLRDNRERLVELGHLYPESPGRARHTRLSLYVKSESELASRPEWYRQKQSQPAAFRKAFRRRLFSEIERSGLTRVLFSDEGLAELSAPALRRLRRFTGRIAKSLRLVVYLRRQDDHLVSHYQQEVKVGETRQLGEWVQQDMSDTYAYYSRLRTWERLLEPDQLVVRRFEPGHFVGGSLFQDFLEAADIDARAEDMVQSPSRNVSLDAESVEFLRLLNLYRVENEAARVGLIDNRKVVARLAEVSGGPTLTLPSGVLDEFMTRWERSNQAVASDLLGDTAGELFRTPRKTSNTTTEQRLDPYRLDYFLALLELPEQVHLPLRRLVEREAKGPLTSPTD